MSQLPPGLSWPDVAMTGKRGIAHEPATLPRGTPNKHYSLRILCLLPFVVPATSIYISISIVSHFDGAVKRGCRIFLGSFSAIGIWELVMRCWKCAWLLVICVFAIRADRALAIGWDGDDFLIGGGPSFTTKIGVFDHDLTFKGYLDSNFITVAGMDFDAEGHLVAVASSVIPEVRVYDSSGTVIGGFVRNDNLLGVSADLKVTPTGDYVIATHNSGAGGDGAREFKPDGTFVRQYGAGDYRGAAVIPGNRLWIGGISSPEISVFDLSSGVQTGTIAVTGPSGYRSITDSSSTGTVLATSGGSVWELDFQGRVLRQFTTQGPLSLASASRGPSGDVFATDSSQRLLRWHADGTFVGSISTSATLGNVYGIVWAGAVPEPGATAMIVGAAFMLRTRIRRGTPHQS